MRDVVRIYAMEASATENLRAETVNDGGLPVLYALVTGSPAARDVGRLVDLAQADGWDVCVIASPDGRRFIDFDVLAAKTGQTVRSAYKDPDASDVLPPADAMIVAPITCNSLVKWAAGISDTLPLGLFVEAVGKRQPVVPCRSPTGHSSASRLVRTPFAS